ncbi:MAG: PIN domain-containing protein [Nanoarchaeota archaeon]
MELVVDANVFFSALMRNSHTRHFLLLGGHTLYTSEFVLEEIMKYIDEICEKTLLSREEIVSLLNEIILLANIRIIPVSEYKAYVKAAQEICPDSNDVHYFALALKLKFPIWSNDKKLKDQEKVKVYASHELVEF